MLPLSYAPIGEQNVIRKVSGNTEVKQHLEALGFTAGAIVSVVSSVNGHLIVSVKGTRIALDEKLAVKIMI